MEEMNFKLLGRGIAEKKQNKKTTVIHIFASPKTLG